MNNKEGKLSRRLASFYNTVILFSVLCWLLYLAVSGALSTRTLYSSKDLLYWMVLALLTYNTGYAAWVRFSGYKFNLAGCLLAGMAVVTAGVSSGGFGSKNILLLSMSALAVFPSSCLQAGALGRSLISREGLPFLLGMLWSIALVLLFPVVISYLFAW